MPLAFSLGKVSVLREQVQERDRELLELRRECGYHERLVDEQLEDNHKLLQNMEMQQKKYCEELEVSSLCRSVVFLSHVAFLGEFFVDTL